MRAVFFSRSLTVVLSIAAILVGGCVRSLSPRFYTLNSIQEGQVISKRPGQTRTGVIGIGPVKLADYLDQSKIVTQTSDNQMVKAEFDRWVGSLNDNFTNVLADDIGSLLPTDQIYRYPWRASVPIDYQVVVDVVRFDGRLGDAAWLEARWRVLRGSEKRLIKMKRFSRREPVTGPDYGALVEAQSRAVATLSQEIAQAIQGAGRH